MAVESGIRDVSIKDRQKNRHFVCVSQYLIALSTVLKLSVHPDLRFTSVVPRPRRSGSSIRSGLLPQ